VGVCFVPYERAAEVLAAAQVIAANEDKRLKMLEEGMSLANFVKVPRK
jgi:regulator of RNase E activity RraA